MRIGIDIGSTTIKCVVLDDNANVLYSTYQRHYSHIKENLIKILNILSLIVLISYIDNIKQFNLFLSFTMQSLSLHWKHR